MIILNGIQELKVLKHTECQEKKETDRETIDTRYNNKGKSFEENWLIPKTV